MKKSVHHIEYLEMERKELSEDEQKLSLAAEKAALKAYAPYSKFRVGAAVLLDNGEIITGNNQENVAYPSGLCAERVALFSAKANYPEASIEALSIVAFSGKGQDMEVLAPCGACRQVMAEYQNLQDELFPVLLLSEDKDRILKFRKTADLLPFSFSVSGLGES